MSPSNTAARHFVHAIGKKWSAWLSGDQTREIHWSNIFSPCLVAYRHFFRGNVGWHSVSCVDNDVLVLQLQPENNSQSQSLEFLIMLNCTAESIVVWTKYLFTLFPSYNNYQYYYPQHIHMLLKNTCKNLIFLNKEKWFIWVWQRTYIFL